MSEVGRKGRNRQLHYTESRPRVENNFDVPVKHSHPPIVQKNQQFWGIVVELERPI
jgi:hypothetical protein